MSGQNYTPSFGQTTGLFFYNTHVGSAGTWELEKERLRVRGAGWEKHGGVSFTNNYVLGLGKGHKGTEL